MRKIVEVSAGEVPLLRELFLEYASTLSFALDFQGFEEEIKNLPGSYAAPHGSALLAFEGGELAGCVALRPLVEGVAEMKRLYVRPGFQGQGLGRALAESIVEKAAELRYQTIRLDTVPSMKAAIGMYRSMGFYIIAPYRENPVPGASYWEKLLLLPR
jgi:ribosomal protein S18 acetylase RimI-like enzyme